MSVFITGSTGFIGSQLVQELARTGITIHALYRSEEKIKKLKKPNIKFFNGDILNVNSLNKAMSGCKFVYHVAAFTNVWAKDKNIIYELNVTGTQNVLEVQELQIYCFETISDPSQFNSVCKKLVVVSTQLSEEVVNTPNHRPVTSPST